jgi:acetylglutamate kinase
MSEQANYRAQTLLEALPYIQRFSGQTVVVKYGGSAMKDEALKKSFALNAILLREVGIYPVVVHGGGPQIGQLLEAAGHLLRVRGRHAGNQAPEVMDVVQMVLVGQVNTSIVGLINHHGGKAVGLNGHSGLLTQAEKMTVTPPERRGPAARDH